MIPLIYLFHLFIGGINEPGVRVTRAPVGVAANTRPKD